MAYVDLSAVVIGGPRSKSQETARPRLIALATGLDTSVIALGAFRHLLFPLDDVFGDFKSTPACFVVGRAPTGSSNRQHCRLMRSWQRLMAFAADLARACTYMSPLHRSSSLMKCFSAAEEPDP